MFAKTKYISFETNEFGSGHTAVIFTEEIGHDEMARRLKLEKPQIKGAGFVDFVNSKKQNAICLKPYGDSVSLDIGNHDNDVFVLNQRFTGQIILNVGEL